MNASTLRLGVVVSLVLAALLSLVWFLGAQTGPAPLSISSLEGDVTRERDGVGEPARAGMVLAQGDDVRTGEASTAVLSRAGHAPVQIAERSTVHVGRIDDTIVEISLTLGRIEARVRPDEGALRITSGRRSVLATDAAFEVSVPDDERFGVKTTRGMVTVAGVAGGSPVLEGEQMVARGQRLERLSPIPAELLLDVDWPEPSVQSTVHLEGRTEPATRLHLQLEDRAFEATADAKGAFSLDVPLQPRAQEVVLTATDTFGTQKEVKARLERLVPSEATPSGGPTFRLHLDYDRR